MNTFNIEPENVITGYISGSVSAVIIPIQLIVIKTLFCRKDLWNNSSYHLLFRLLLLELSQSMALVLTAFFTLFPVIANFDALRKVCSLVLSTGFMMNFVLMYELSILRILVVTKKCDPDRLPLLMIIFEVGSSLTLLGLSVPAYIFESMKFEAGDWYYDEDIIAVIMDRGEVYFCIPVLVITYCAYLALIMLIYVKRKRFSDHSSSKQEWLLFLQSTFITVYYIFLIYDWHVIDAHLSQPYWLQVLSSVAWATAYYWNSLLLLIFNKTVRSHVFSSVKNSGTVSTL